MSLPAVSKHLKVLERAGLITRTRDAQMRPCQIDARALKEADDWLEEYRRLWEERLDRLDDYLKTLQARRSKASERKIMAAKNNIDLERDPRSIIGTRIFNAPRDLVFSAFTDPKHLAQWWGPDGFTHDDAHLSNFAPAASGVSSCMARTAATTRTGLPMTRSFRPNALSITMAAATMLSQCNSARP